MKILIQVLPGMGWQLSPNCVIALSPCHMHPVANHISKLLWNSSLHLYSLTFALMWIWRESITSYTRKVLELCVCFELHFLTSLTVFSTHWPSFGKQFQEPNKNSQWANIAAVLKLECLLISLPVIHSSKISERTAQGYWLCTSWKLYFVTFLLCLL